MHVDTRSPAHNRASRRLKVAYTGLTSVAATGVVILAAGGFLDDMAPGDLVSFINLTGGSSIEEGKRYFLLGRSGPLVRRRLRSPSGAEVRSSCTAATSRSALSRRAS